MEHLKLEKIVAYAMKKLKENDRLGRTFVQKIVYFFLDEKKRFALYSPYLYGPYSSQVQRIIQFYAQEILSA